MPGLTIGWEYLTGYAVATDPGSRDRAEWPPHPGRVFMALAAAWFETGKDQVEGDALRWLESLGHPELYIPSRQQVAERTNVTVYVPVNDKAGPSTASLQSAPALTRSKQPRTFPRVHIGDAPCLMRWVKAEGTGQYHEALDRLCSKVTRIGHSSSLVRMWVSDTAQWNESNSEHLTPDDKLADRQMRSISAGLLDMLTERYGETPRRQRDELNDQINALNVSKKITTQKRSKAQKLDIDTEIHRLKEQLGNIVSRSPIRPTLGLWSGYRRADDKIDDISLAHPHFDKDILVLTKVYGPELPLVSTLVITQALRNTLIKHLDRYHGEVPSWVHGHQNDGSPSADPDGHLALIPLPFVGHPHADGHLLGVGLVFPKPEQLNRQERGRALGPLLLNDDGQSQEVELRLGKLGCWRLRKWVWTDEAKALQPETWTTHPNGVTTWASVTPVVLDKFPKADRVKDRVGWTDEVTNTIAQACLRVGLPEPDEIKIDTTCWHLGSPRAVGKRRTLRGRNGSDGHNAALGDGFPFYPAKRTNASRPQVHVRLKFADKIVGPILLGAGRYQGYGLFKPLDESQESR